MKTGRIRLKRYLRNFSIVSQGRIGRLTMICMLAAASPCAAEPQADTGSLNLQCFESAAPGGKKHYNVFWLDFKNNVITIGSAFAGSNSADDPAVDAVSSTVPVTTTAEDFSFENNGSLEKIGRKNGIYVPANGKQERCWKGTVPIPAARF